MASTIKVLSEEVTLTSANTSTVSDATLVRLVSLSANTVITVANTSGTIGTFTMLDNSKEIVEKKPTDTIGTNNDVLATSIAYTA